MDRNQVLAMAGVLFVALAVFLLGWQSAVWFRDKDDERRRLAAADRPVPYHVTRRGWVDFVDYGPAPGAADRGQYEIPRADPMAMAATGYQLGYDRHDADDAHREAAAIWAEVEANPEKYGWRTR